MTPDEMAYAQSAANTLAVDPTVDMGKVFDDYEASMSTASSRMKDITAFWDETYDRLQNPVNLQGESMPWHS